MMAVQYLSCSRLMVGFLVPFMTGVVLMFGGRFEGRGFEGVVDVSAFIVG